MASWQETFLSLPIDARRRYAELYCRKGMRAKVGRLPPFNPYQLAKQSKQEILDFAKRHQVVTQDEMYTAIHDFPNENPPSMDQIIWLFGSYNAFKDEIQSDPSCWSWSNRIGDEQLARYCSMLKIKNLDHYNKLRKTKVGEMLPSRWQIEKRFGSWLCFFTLVLSFNIDKHLEHYFRESIRAGRSLTIRECDKLGIEIRYLKSCLTEELFNLVVKEKEKLFKENNPNSYLSKDHDTIKVLKEYHEERKRNTKRIRRTVSAPTSVEI